MSLSLEPLCGGEPEGLRLVISGPGEDLTEVETQRPHWGPPEDTDASRSPKRQVVIHSGYRQICVRVYAGAAIHQSEGTNIGKQGRANAVLFRKAGWQADLS